LKKRAFRLHFFGVPLLVAFSISYRISTENAKISHMRGM